MESTERLPLLVVDDDRSTLAIARAWLSGQGWDPECLADPLEALEAFSRRRHLAAVVDWHLPRLDGLELVRRLRARNLSRSVYVVLVTSSEDSRLLPQAFDEGVDDFIRKPFEKAELLARMKAARRVCLLDREIRERSEGELERRIHAMALQRVSALVGAVAHELRTPLGVVRLATDRLRMRDDRFDPQTLRVLDRLDQGVGALAETMENALETFGLSNHPPRWTPLEMTEIVTSAVGAAREFVRPGVELTLETAPEADRMEGLGNPASLQRLVTNLLRNSTRHTGSGSIRVRLRRPEEGSAEVEVADTGEGIAEELHPWLGEPLLLNSENSGFGRFAGGNGMGLSLCRRIVQRHGGSLSVRTRQGAGTRIVATLRLDLPGPAPVDGPDRFFVQSGDP